MRCPKHRKKLPTQNFEKLSADVCPRCARSTKFKISGNNPKLLTYYKSLCRNSNCLVHKKISSMKNIKKGATKRKKVCSKVNLNEKQLQHKYGNIVRKRTLITLFAQKSLKAYNFFRNISSKSCYIIDEFEEDKTDDIDFKMYKKIDATVEELDKNTSMNFNNTAGHRFIKEIIKKTVVWPLRNPKTFKGLRSAPKGLLLFGPPGSGKTFLGKLIAAETNSTFFNVSPSLLISKWLGENEKLVRTMFIVAKARQPSVIFVDEIDSILSKSGQDENGSMKRMRNEFLFCMGDSNTSSEDRITVIGATNRPFELDEGSRHKFSKRIYIPLPDVTDRKEILLKLLENECHSLENIDMYDIVKKTEGYSVSDLKSLCQEAAMGPIKGLAGSAIHRLKPDKIRPISMEDFLTALELIKPTVTPEQIKSYETWDYLYGYGGELNPKI